MLTACNANEWSDSQKMKEEIDLLPFSKTMLEIETDSSGNTLDTLAVDSFKYDEKGQKRFQKRTETLRIGKRRLEVYFLEDEDLFSREIFEEGGQSISLFETKLDGDGKLLEAIQIEKRLGSNDTLFMNYTYDRYPNGNVKTLTITTAHPEIKGSFSKRAYDEFKKLLYEVVIYEGDTTSFQTWEYEDTQLVKSVFIYYGLDTIQTIYHFKSRKVLTQSEQFEIYAGKYIKSMETHYTYDQEGERTQSVEKDLKTGESTYIQYLKQ